MPFALEIPEDLAIVTDREKLELILSNLFSNAIAYGTPGTPVTCAAALSGNGFTLRVANCHRRADRRRAAAHLRPFLAQGRGALRGPARRPRA